MEGGNRTTVTLHEITTLSMSVEVTSTPTRKCDLPYHTIPYNTIPHELQSDDVSAARARSLVEQNLKTTSICLSNRSLVQCTEPSSRNVRKGWVCYGFYLNSCACVWSDYLQVKGFSGFRYRNKVTCIDTTALTLRYAVGAP